jgi:hypothetical protein
MQSESQIAFDADDVSLEQMLANGLEPRPPGSTCALFRAPRSTGHECRPAEIPLQ